MVFSEHYQRNAGQTFFTVGQNRFTVGRFKLTYAIFTVGNVRFFLV